MWADDWSVAMFRCMEGLRSAATLARSSLVPSQVPGNRWHEGKTEEKRETMVVWGRAEGVEIR